MKVLQDENCIQLIWEADSHGSCEIDLMLTFTMSDNIELNRTVPVMSQSYRYCNKQTPRLIKLDYKSVVYIREANGTRRQTGESVLDVFKKKNLSNFFRKLSKDSVVNP